ncbi:Conserved_hypothetical protein [Hexamita inflata]|uniref:Uncharacterized protein n=1 Tax=Hexamita inflata TaxID=28002 RepID=A0AA86UWW5_9EUKA|nr:Conserved hypothetical protein [Hexamita inflata]
MNALIESLQKYTFRKITDPAECFGFSIVLKEILAELPPLPMQPELTPQATHFEQQLKRTQLNQIGQLLLGSFEHNCSTLNFVTLAARTLHPYQCRQVATQEAARRVVWAFDAGKISKLDYISYSFILVIATLCNQEQPDEFYDYESLKQSALEPVNQFTQQRQQVLNGLQNTLLVMKTEIGVRRNTVPHSFTYNLVQIAELLLLIKNLQPDATEELVFENICQKAVQQVSGTFQLCFDQLTESGQTVKGLWTRKSANKEKPNGPMDLIQNNAEKEEELNQIVLVVCCSGCLAFQMIQEYIEKVGQVYQLQVKVQEEQAKDQQKATDTLKQLQESGGSLYLNKTLINTQTNKVYRRFNDLTQEEQHKIKFQATDSLFDYITLKKQLGLNADQQLFEDDFSLQVQLKRTQLDIFLDKTKLRNVQRQAESMIMTSKTQDIAQLPIYVPQYIPSNNKPRLAKDSLQSNGTRKVPQVMAMEMKEYAREVQKMFFHAMHQQFQNWHMVKKALLLLLHVRAIYGGRMFGITDFQDIIKFYELEQEQPVPEVDIPVEEKMHVTQQQVVLVDANKSMTKQKTVKIETELSTQKMQKLELEVKMKVIKSRMDSLRYTNSKMRLLIDNSIVGKTHDLFLSFIRWLSTFSKVDAEQTQIKKVIELRNFCQLITNRILNGGDEFGFIPYLTDFGGIFDIMADEKQMRTFSADEVAGIIITFWVLPYNMDLYQVIKMLLKHALGCNPVLLHLLKQILGDMYIYLDAAGTDIDYATLLFNAE